MFGRAIIRLGIGPHSSLLLTHAITGCDTVAAYSGISKNVETSRFILACYGQSCETTMPLSRKKIWKQKIGRSQATAPKLASLPPTDETFEVNARRAFLQFKI